MNPRPFSKSIINRFMLFMMLFVFCSSLNVAGQRAVTGKVTDEVNGQPVIASVFLSNTSIGTTTDSEGKFNLRIPDGRYEMIISAVGYQTKAITISAGQKLELLSVVLAPKVKELEDVKVEPFEKDGWQTWGRLFTENFIGTGDAAADCRIINYDAVKFRNSKKTGELTAHVFEPLIIENKSLGYTIQYQLEEFTYNFKTRVLFYAGYPLFIPMQGNERKQKHWARERDKVYYGSQMHFMRALYRNKVAEEGFEIRLIKKVQNKEKERVNELMRLQRLGSNTITVRSRNADSSKYYQAVLRQPDIYDELDDNIIPADSIAFAANMYTAALTFDNYLQIKYTKAYSPDDYLRVNRYAEIRPTSTITLLNNRPVLIQQDGMHYEGRDLLSSGYWGWSEKMARMLPFNFKPSSPKK